MNKIITAILTLIISIYLICCDRTPTLEVTSEPSGAKVILDGKEIGITPIKIQPSPGEHRLMVAKLGYYGAAANIPAKIDDIDELKLNLKRISTEDMIKIPAGPFLMGSSDEEITKVVRDLGGGELGPDVGWFAAERPQHEASVEEFYIDKYEVTNEKYKAFVEAVGKPTPRDWEGGTYPEGKGDHPVVYVSWEDANEYCHWVGKRLPTETEWEKAARGTDARIWPWGNTFDITKCNVESWEGSGSTPVGSYPDGVSPYGVYDMAGNVWEWTDSWYDAYPGSDHTTTEFGKKVRVLRGGSWYHYNSLGPIGARCASRDRAVPQSISYVAGFRCAIGVDELAE
ncbi:SUMF1/EgtB/PvdO family nonheme iron enzyme [Candidatus Poribacteria bacterium]|nr:SUMF1/EgtB/PvdO family nonheme iron enzyme [Candidatus Poribacteria bacterium]